VLAPPDVTLMAELRPGGPAMHRISWFSSDEMGLT
jgi:hypothetical protein